MCVPIGIHVQNFKRSSHFRKFRGYSFGRSILGCAVKSTVVELLLGETADNLLISLKGSISNNAFSNIH